jgi:hypothetical protein
LRASQELARVTHLRCKGVNFFFFCKDFALRRVLQGALLTQGYILMSWWWTLASSMWCLICRHAENKSCKVVEASPRFQSLEGQAMCGRLRIPAGSLLEGNA